MRDRLLALFGGAATGRARRSRVAVRVSVLLCALLCACAGPQMPQAPPAFLFKDASFVAPEERYRADDLFAVSDRMQHFLRVDIAHQLRRKGPVDGLIDALYRQGQLKLAYDASTTRTASEAFDARAGNCLSLVIMTAAFAKELNLGVRYNAARTEEVWARSGGLLVGSGHVNITLSQTYLDPGAWVREAPLTVDFLPADEIGELPIREIPERIVIAMYMNNRGAEALVAGDLDDAYGWTREAILRSPEFDKAYNTLGIVYARHGDLAQAERVFQFELERDPKNATVMFNLAEVLSQAGRQSEAAALRARLARIDPDPPYYYFDLGVQAMQRNDFEAAKSLFAKEVLRADYSDEFHFWLGLAYFKLGDIDRARRQLRLAIDRTHTHKDHDLYTAKLAWLQSSDHPRLSAPAVFAPSR
jgi:Flp pilus assembly protein TadD